MYVGGYVIFNTPIILSGSTEQIFEKTTSEYDVLKTALELRKPVFFNLDLGNGTYTNILGMPSKLYAEGYLAKFADLSLAIDYDYALDAFVVKAQ